MVKNGFFGTPRAGGAWLELSVCCMGRSKDLWEVGVREDLN